MSDDWRSLSPVSGEPWAFTTAPWIEEEPGVVTSPPQPADDSLAISTAAAYRDFQAEFDFRWEIQGSDSGFVFRARHARHYYLVHFPCTGQQFRGGNFWAAISKVDASGWARVLRTEIVPGIPSEIGLWHTVKLQVQGPEIRLWVDGRPFPVVIDDSYDEPGYVGLETYNGRDPDEVKEYFGDARPRVGSGNSFRNVRLRGEPLAAPPWDATVAPGPRLQHPLADTAHGAYQYVSSLVRLASGEVLLTLVASDAHTTGTRSVLLLRSHDAGRTWSAPEVLPNTLHGAALHPLDGDHVVAFLMQHDPPFDLSIVESTDAGRTWSEPSGIGRVTFDDELDVAHAYLSKVVPLRDGTLLRFGYSVAAGPSMHGGVTRDGWRYVGAPTPGSFSYCVRSTDGGRTWSPPIRVDGPNPRPGMLVNARETASETSACEVAPNRILALIRPETSPWMWECWSTDGGRTWAPAARGQFPMYACTDAITATAQGAVVVAGRHPGIGAQLSQDGGMSWQATRIDTPFYANGSTLEVEPDVVLYVYDGKYSDARVRAQRLRVTPGGLEPADA